MRYHKAHLTRRLILDTSSDSEKEENMVEWLREVGMPADYVNKLARMFQDIKVSQDLNQQFKEQCRAALADSINIKVIMLFYRIYVQFHLKPEIKERRKTRMRFVRRHFCFKYTTLRCSLQILNAGAWARGSERVTVSLPLQLEDYIPEVEEFYKKKHSGRKLLWYHHMSNGTVRYM